MQARTAAAAAPRRLQNGYKLVDLVQGRGGRSRGGGGEEERQGRKGVCVCEGETEGGDGVGYWWWWGVAGGAGSPWILPMCSHEGRDTVLRPTD